MLPLGGAKLNPENLKERTLIPSRTGFGPATFAWSGSKRARDISLEHGAERRVGNNGLSWGVYTFVFCCTYCASEKQE